MIYPSNHKLSRDEEKVVFQLSKKVYARNMSMDVEDGHSFYIIQSLRAWASKDAS